MNILTNVLSTSFDSLKRRLIKIRAFGLNDIRTPFEANAFGIDSNPIKDMRAVYAETSAKGDRVIVGYINKNQLAGVGETRLFSTDANGILKTYLWLHSDGTMDIGGNANHMTQFEALKTAFDQLKSDFNSHVAKYNAHLHTGVTTGGGSSGTTPQTSTSSSADMSGAKLETIKTL